jgi:tetratricopeptide (TPR) repeat protein
MRKWTIVISGAVFALILLGNLGCSETESVDSLKQKGIKAFVNGDYKQAREYLTEGLQQAPSDRDLLYFTGLSYKREFMYDSALVYLKRSSLLHKNDREVAQALLEVALALEEWKIAFSAVGTLIDTGDSEREHYLLLAQLHREMDYPINEFYYLRKYLALHPEDSTRYTRLANVSMMVDSARVGLNMIDTAIARFGEKPQFLATKAVLLGYEQQYRQAEGILRGLLASADSTDAANIKLNLANVLAEQNSAAKQREAVGLYREVKPILGNQYPIDSLIAVTEKKLGES